MTVWGDIDPVFALPTANKSSTDFSSRLLSLRFIVPTPLFYMSVASAL